MPKFKCTFSTDALFKEIVTQSVEEIELLNRRKRILCNALASFNERLACFSEWERKAILSLLYKRVTDTIFEFHRCLENTVARQSAENTTTTEDKVALIREFRVITDNLAILYELDEE